MITPASLDAVAVLVFAVTGALRASRAQLDVIGFIFLGCLTAVGGGTVRDLLLGRDPVFWIETPSQILLAAGASVTVFFTAHLVESRARALLWLDAAALAVATSAGIAAADGLDRSPGVVMVMGMVTGTLGGIMRDVVCNEVPLVLRAGELYVSAAFAGAGAGVLLIEYGAPPLAALLSCLLTTFGLRAASLALGWRLPVYKARPPRDPGN